MKKTTFLRHAIATTLIAVCATGASAQTAAWPTRPVTLVVPFPAGGSVDLTARMLAQKLTLEWKQAVVVDNRSGAAGTIGTSSVARAPADGYTLLMATNATHAANAAMYAKMPYDPLKDFAPIALIGSAPLVWVVAKSPASGAVDSYIR